MKLHYHAIMTIVEKKITYFLKIMQNAVDAERFFVYNKVEMIGDGL